MGKEGQEMVMWLERMEGGEAQVVEKKLSNKMEGKKNEGLQG